MGRGRRVGKNGDKSYKGFNSASEDGLRAVALLSKAPAGQAGRLAGPSRESLRKFIASQTCPWCGRGPYKSLAIHTHNAHGVSADELREMAGLIKHAPLCSAELSSNYADRRRGQRLPDSAYERNNSSPRKFSEAGLAVQRAKLDSARSPEQARRAGEAIGRKVMAANADKYRRVVELFQEGRRIKDISAELKVSIPLIMGALKRAGVAENLRRRRWDLMSDEERREQMARARAALNESLARRSEDLLRRFEELGCTRQAVAQMAVEQGVSLKSMTAQLKRRGADVPDGRAEPKPSKYGSPQLVAEVVRLYESGLSQSQVGARVGIRQNVVSQILRKAGAETRPFTRARQVTDDDRSTDH